MIVAGQTRNNEVASLLCFYWQHANAYAYALFHASGDRSKQGLIRAVSHHLRTLQINRLEVWDKLVRHFVDWSVVSGKQEQDYGRHVVKGFFDANPHVYLQFLQRHHYIKPNVHGVVEGAGMHPTLHTMRTCPGLYLTKLTCF